MNRIVLLFTLPLFLASACGGDAPAPDKKHKQAAKAKEAANSLTFDENAEIDNIKRRLEITSSPGKIGYVVLLNEAGQPILYTSVKGKLTSGSKRLTRPVELTHGSRGQYSGDFVVPGPSDEGTYGSSSPYVYFWTHEDRYVQWSGDYLYSDQPVRLRVKPLVINITDDQPEPEPAAAPAPTPETAG